MHKILTTKRGIPKYMAVPNWRRMTVGKKNKIDDNLNSAQPIHTKLAEDVKNHNNYNIAKFQAKIINLANVMEETINPV